MKQVDIFKFQCESQIISAHLKIYQITSVQGWLVIMLKSLSRKPDLSLDDAWILHHGDQVVSAWDELDSVEVVLEPERKLQEVA